MTRASRLTSHAFSIALVGLVFQVAAAAPPGPDGTRTDDPAVVRAVLLRAVTAKPKADKDRCDHGCRHDRTHGARLGRARGCADCDSGCDGACGARGPVRRMIQSTRSAMHSGQPLVDPWMRADWIAQQRTAMQSWHAGYYHTQYGMPLALVVPPTARMQTRWGWGVAQSTMLPIHPQFKRPYPGPAVGGEMASGTGAVLPTPRWPSHTDQFGVYYVRGPW